MLSVPNDGRYPRLELDPQQRRQQTLEALSRSNPILMIFEDVVPWFLSNLAKAYGDLGELDNAWRCIDEA
jgi:hypothetical protein